jgi:hypothetical protein
MKSKIESSSSQETNTWSHIKKKDDESNPSSSKHESEDIPSLPHPPSTVVKDEVKFIQKH